MRIGPRVRTPAGKKATRPTPGRNRGIDFIAGERLGCERTLNLSSSLLPFHVRVDRRIRGCSASAALRKTSNAAADKGSISAAPEILPLAPAVAIAAAADGFTVS